MWWRDASAAMPCWQKYSTKNIGSDLPYQVGLIYFTKNIIFEFKGSCLKVVGDGAVLLPYLDSAASNL